MRRHGINFGPHGVARNSLALLYEREIPRELERSKARLVSETGVSTKGFAYAWGTSRDTLLRIGQLIMHSWYSWAVSGIVVSAGTS